MTSLLNLQSGEDTDPKAHIVALHEPAGLSRRAATNITQLAALHSSGYGKNAALSFIVLPLPPRRAAVAGSRTYRKWRGAARLRADGDLLVRQDAGRAGDDDPALDGGDGLIERLQRRVEPGEEHARGAASGGGGAALMQ